MVTHYDVSELRYAAERYIDSLNKPAQPFPFDPHKVALDALWGGLDDDAKQDILERVIQKLKP